MEAHLGRLTCPRCRAPLLTPLACGACRTVFDEAAALAILSGDPPSDADAPGAGPAPQAARLDCFARLGLPRAFDLDRRALEKNYIAISRLLHPDLFAERPEEEREVALRHAASINGAYRALKSPLERALYLLRTCAPVEVAQGRDTPPGLLAEILDLREEFEARRSSPDAAGYREWLATTLAVVERGRDQWESRLPALFSRFLDGGDLAAAREAREALNVLKYYVNLADEMRRERDTGG
ncbi:MAG: hypothetical protein HY719_06110 [Planctomycetes bacterium]|nr:hypothetical protein [Planctomycetota bacterium]